MITLGFDAGSSSVKAAVVDVEKGKILAAASWPEEEMPIDAPRPGWAEQDPDMWWSSLVRAARLVLEKSGITTDRIQAIGLSYQMHGLVLLDKDDKVLRPSIIWCDSRAVETGDGLAKKAGTDYCFAHLLNQPGNFTAAKLAWVKQYEPAIFDQAATMMLPGDYLALRLTGEKNTTVTGLSEGILWDFVENKPALPLFEAIGASPDLVPDLVPVFGDQGRLTPEAAKALGLNPGIPVSYRAGDQPNNALSLNVLQPGEVAATAGTSGVVYGVSDKYMPDISSRVNIFAHVNHDAKDPRVGILLCINGTGIQNAWIRRNVAPGLSYDEMNAEAMTVPEGSEGLLVYPFGNGAERVLGNRAPGGRVQNLDFNRHTRAHLIRAAQEGIAFSLAWGLGVMRELGMEISVIHAGNANMFLSPVFAQTFSSAADVGVELYDTDGAAGAAMGAAMGTGAIDGPEDIPDFPAKVKTFEPGNHQAIGTAFGQWKEELYKTIKP